MTTSGFLQADSDVTQPQDATTKKPAAGKAVAAPETKKTEAKVAPNQSKASAESKPPLSEKVQVTEQMDIKGGNHLVVQVEAVKKPQNANKLQELTAMEEALKRATEEAHRQRLALVGQSDVTDGTISLAGQTVQS